MRKPCGTNLEWVGSFLAIFLPKCRKSSYSTATGYVTTAEYKGRVTSSGVSSITYTVVYTGTLIEPEPAEVTEPGGLPALLAGSAVLPLLGCILLLALAGLGIFLFLRRKNVYVYIPGDKPRDYRLIAKFRVDADTPVIDLSGVEPYPTDIVAVEVKRQLAKKLAGRDFTVHHQGGDHVYTVLQEHAADWHEFDLSAEEVPV